MKKKKKILFQYSYKGITIKHCLYEEKGTSNELWELKNINYNRSEVTV